MVLNLQRSYKIKRFMQCEQSGESSAVMFVLSEAALEKLVFFLKDEGKRVWPVR